MEICSIFFVFYFKFSQARLYKEAVEEAVKFLQSKYEVISDWNVYGILELSYLRKYVAITLFGLPTEETESNAFFYGNEDAAEKINTVYNKICLHGKQTDKSIMCNVIYVCTYNENLIRNEFQNNILDKLSIHPIFIIKKNAKNTQYNNWYIDVNGRVYKGWQDFLKNNTLPNCIMITPKDGIYQGNLREMWSDEKSPIWIDINVNRSNTFVEKMDAASMIASFATLGTACASFFAPTVVITTG